jgi:flagellar protein FliO/FliZ
MTLDSLFTVITVFVGILASAIACFAFFARGRGGDLQGFFTTRGRRLGFIERAYLDGGRKLLLVRRDDVEHLILIGGPIDLVVETGIKAEAYPAGATVKKDYSDTNAAAWQEPEIYPAPAKAPQPAKPRFLAAAMGAASALRKAASGNLAEPQQSLTQGSEKKKESGLLKPASLQEELNPRREEKAAQ